MQATLFHPCPRCEWHTTSLCTQICLSKCLIWLTELVKRWGLRCMAVWCLEMELKRRQLNPTLSKNPRAVPATRTAHLPTSPQPVCPSDLEAPWQPQTQPPSIHSLRAKHLTRTTNTWLVTLPTTRMLSMKGTETLRFLRHPSILWDTLTISIRARIVWTICTLQGSITNHLETIMHLMSWVESHCTLSCLNTEEKLPRGLANKARVKNDLDSFWELTDHVNLLLEVAIRLEQLSHLLLKTLSRGRKEPLLRGLQWIVHFKTIQSLMLMHTPCRMFQLRSRIQLMIITEAVWMSLRSTISCLPWGMCSARLGKIWTSHQWQELKQQASTLSPLSRVSYNKPKTITAEN